MQVERDFFDAPQVSGGGTGSQTCRIARSSKPSGNTSNMDLNTQATHLKKITGAEASILKIS